MSETVRLLGEELVFSGIFLSLVCIVYMLDEFCCTSVMLRKQAPLRGCAQQVFSNIIAQQNPEQY